MKKYLTVFAILIVALVFVGCSGTASDNTAEDSAVSPVTDDVTEHLHEFKKEIIPATCTRAGSVISKCECGVVWGETQLPYADHVLSAFSCEKDTVCTVCNTVVAEKIGHTVTDTRTVKSATCSEMGKEQGKCSTCGKMLENDIPVRGHRAEKNSVWTIAQDGFRTTCTVCNKVVTMKEAEPVIFLGFEENLETEVAKYAGFKGVGSFESVNDIDGDKAANITTCFIDVTDNSVINDLGTYLVSFDFMITGDSGRESDETSVFTIISNCEGGKTGVGGSTQWGYALKFNEGADKLETLKAEGDYSKLNASNSIAVVRNTKYKVQLLVSEGADKFQVYINGKSYGMSQASFSGFDEGKKMSLRLGDGAKCGMFFDNFKVVGLK